MPQNPDLAAERRYLAKADERLETMRRSARETMEIALSTPRGGTPQARAERDVIVRQCLARLEQLEIGDQALTFGGIDYGEPLGSVCTYHIGRLAVADENMEPLVVDWRAPVAEPFYRATGKEPMGLTRRRHFALGHKTLEAIEDEYLGVFEGPKGHDSGDEVILAGPGALFAAMTRPRSGRMADIVSTIQGQQDEIIRAPLAGIHVVQGGPGTGKTAVALHRAAYLLYTHRMRLERQGVLVVAPNRTFARYIDQVLPSLGETGVQIMTLTGLAGFGEVELSESVGEARLKGDLRMAAFVAKAVRDRERPTRRSVDIPMGAFLVTVLPQETADAVSAAKRRSGPHNTRRRFLESALAQKVVEKYLVKKDQGSRDANTSSLPTGDGQVVTKIEGFDPARAEKRELMARVRQSLEFQSLVERIWPILTPQALLDDLFSHFPLIRLAGKGILAEDEMRLLFRRRDSNEGRTAWSKSDAILLNEAKLHLGSCSSKAHEEERRYGHIIVDEAQDLSPMAARMVGRYSLSSSMTLVGDIAQATSPFGIRPWTEIVSPMPKSDSFEIFELRVNYRTPQEVMDVAGALVRVAFPDLRTPISIRRTGNPVTLFRVINEDFTKLLAKVIEAEVEMVFPGTVAVIVPEQEKADYLEDLSKAGLDASPLADAKLAVISAQEAKGMEFDSVVISGADHLLYPSSTNLQALFVAMTRTTNRLLFLHNKDVPDVIVDLLTQK